MLNCTINDFPTYNNLSSYNVKGNKACPICEENTTTHQLKHRRKAIYIYICHQKCLQPNNPNRRLKKHLMDIKRMTILQFHKLAFKFMKNLIKYIMTLGKRKKSHL